MTNFATATMRATPRLRVEEIIERAERRRILGKPVLPGTTEEEEEGGTRITEEKKEEWEDAWTLQRWRWLGQQCPMDILEALDERLPEWDAMSEERLVARARKMVERADRRKCPLLPRLVPPQHIAAEEREEEQRDALRLLRWRRLTKKAGNGRLLSSMLIRFVDANLPDWRLRCQEETRMRCVQQAEEIIERAVKRQLSGRNFFPRQCCAVKKGKHYTEEEWQEHHDAERLISWRRSIMGKSATYCSPAAKQMLDESMAGWREYGDLKAYRAAEEIVRRAKERVAAGKHLLPKQMCKKRKSPAEDPDGLIWQEHVDAQKLANWRCALRGSSRSRCSDALRDLLDRELPGWRIDITAKYGALELVKKTYSLVFEEEEGDDRMLEVD